MSTEQRSEQMGNAVDLGAYAGWLFDLDGVRTQTAAIHAAAWDRGRARQGRKSRRWVDKERRAAFRANAFAGNPTAPMQQTLFARRRGWRRQATRLPPALHSP